MELPVAPSTVARSQRSRGRASVSLLGPQVGVNESGLKGAAPRTRTRSPTPVGAPQCTRWDR